jgi:hypothetical protein
MTTLANGYLGGNPDVTPYLQGPVKPPAPNEQGWKDTFIMFPGEVTTMIVRFAPTDLPLDTPEEELIFDFDPSEGPGYVWHCHIIDHEDNEMMRPMEVTVAPGAHPDVITPGSQEPIIEKGVDLPNGFDLVQNSPNPCSGSTEIEFNLAYDHHVTLTLYNSLGEAVQVLINETAPAGKNTVKLDVSGLNEGIYFYRLSLGVGSRSDVKKLVVVN